MADSRFALSWNYKTPHPQGGATGVAPMRPVWQGCGTPERPCHTTPAPMYQLSRAVAGLGTLGNSETILGSDPDDPSPYNQRQLAIAGSLALLFTGASAYHGYKRSGGSVGSAVGWAFLGLIAPIITLPVALAQGFAKRK